MFSSEWVRSFLFGGLPLSLTAHIWSFQYQLISIASYIGVFGLSYLTIYWLVLISSFYTKKVGCFFLIISFPLLLYFIPTSNYENHRNQEKYPVRIVQPNIPQKEKWNRSLYQKNFEKLIHLTKKQITNEKIIVVWPEVALTLFLNEEKELLEYLSTVLPQNIILVTGSLRREFHDSGYKVYNSFFILSDDKVQFYDKIKLVPFGEFIPFKNILDFLKVTPGSTDFTSGSKENNIKLNFNNESIFIEPSICFESIFQTFSFNKINFFINITNDAWFGQTTGPSQHLAATIFRSVEKGVPLVRSANSGISVIINKNGKIIKSKGLNSAGYIQSNISLGNNKTFFMKVGNTSLILLVCMITFFSIIMDLILKYRKKD
ncbi:MAG: apolipoprotein N-acyltransferase [Alphaproteobacteria bacterium]